MLAQIVMMLGSVQKFENIWDLFPQNEREVIQFDSKLWQNSWLFRL